MWGQLASQSLGQICLNDLQRCEQITLTPSISGKGSMLQKTTASPHLDSIRGSPIEGHTSKISAQGLDTPAHLKMYTYTQRQTHSPPMPSTLLSIKISSCTMTFDSQYGPYKIAFKTYVMQSQRRLDMCYKSCDQATFHWARRRLCHITSLAPHVAHCSLVTWLVAPHVAHCSLVTWLVVHVQPLLHSAFTSSLVRLKKSTTAMCNTQKAGDAIWRMSSLPWCATVVSRY